jgi:hypothetical protein
METTSNQAIPLFHPPPADEHRWLRRLIGEWKLVESNQPSDPAAEPMTETGEEIGDLWVTIRGRGNMPDGTPAVMLMTLGYDVRTSQFVGTWVGSMMAQLWVYRGFLDTANDTLVLEADGPDFENPDRTLRYRDTIQFRGDDERVACGLVQQENGEWTEFMRSVFRRVTADQPAASNERG